MLREIVLDFLAMPSPRQAPRSISVTVLKVDTCAVLQQQFHNIEISALGRQV